MDALYLYFLRQACEEWNAAYPRPATDAQPSCAEMTDVAQFRADFWRALGASGAVGEFLESLGYTPKKP